MVSKVDIRKIVGSDAFARLEKAGKASEDALRVLSPGEVMSVAGIGPVKAGRLLRALGLKVQDSELESVYARLKSRTRFSRVKGFLRNISRDPSDRINAIEGRRAEVIAWQNLLSATRNIGRPESERIRQLSYAPVARTLDPFSVNLVDSSGDKVYAEVFVTPEIGRARISYSVYDSSSGDNLVLENDFVSNKNTVEMLTDIGDMIEDMYNRFRKKTLVGLFYVIVDETFTDSGFYDGLRDRFRRLINEQKMVLNHSVASYYEWEALFKYQDSSVFNAMVDRWNKLHRYLLYDSYVLTVSLDYDEWLSNPEVYEGVMFWAYIENIALSGQRSYQALDLGRRGSLSFGVLKGMGHSDYESWIPISRGELSRMSLYRDEGYASFKGVSRELDVTFGGMKVSPLVLLFSNSVLVDYTAFVSRDNTMIVFQSVKLPEIGILFRAESGRKSVGGVMG